MFFAEGSEKALGWRNVNYRLSQYTPPRGNMSTICICHDFDPYFTTTYLVVPWSYVGASGYGKGPFKSQLWRT
jgi:hypothetical protein